LKWLKTIYAFDKRGLPRARRATNDYDLPLVDFCAAVSQNLKLAVPLADIVDFDHREITE
jgi:c-di-GMP-related signal transduction protein